MKKRILLSLCTVLALMGCNSNNNKIEGVSTVVEITNLGNGDAKFYKDNVITSVDGFLTLIDYDKNTVSYDIPTNWLDCVSGDNLIIYANSSNQTGVIRLKEDNTIEYNEIIFESENLQIDPSIIKLSSIYYLSITEIEGTVNNSDRSVENGEYTIHLYKSINGVEWEYVTNICSYANNLEDVELFDYNGKLGILYEKEMLDKGKSGIYVQIAENEDFTLWDSPKELLSPNYDNEPASLVIEGNQIILYYSSDKNDPGASYMGGNVYMAYFTEDFAIKEKDIQIETDTTKGVLLYDVKESDDKLEFLAALNYLSSNDMAIFREQ